jgi:hypothetical protein
MRLAPRRLGFAGLQVGNAWSAPQEFCTSPRGSPIRREHFFEGQLDKLLGGVSRRAAGMTPENRWILIIETIRAIRIGAPVSKGGVTLLLEPWPDLYWDAMEREGMDWINLLQAAAARIECAEP